MGQFSFMFADKNNMENITHMEEAYVLLPEGQEAIHARYDLYGHFNRHDIFDLVVDINRKHITQSMLSTVKSSPRKLEYTCARLVQEGLSDEEIKKELSKEGYEGMHLNEWKRELGISIACYDEDNAALFYPIKIAKEPVPYDSVPASKADPTQGCEKIAFEVKSTLEETAASFIRFEDAVHCGAWEKDAEEIIANDLDNICAHLNHMGYSYDISPRSPISWQELSRLERDFFRAVEVFENIYPYRIKVTKAEAEKAFGPESRKWRLSNPNTANTVKEGMDGRYPAFDVTGKIAWETLTGKRMSFPEYEIAEEWLKEHVLSQYKKNINDSSYITRSYASLMTGYDDATMMKAIQKKIDEEQMARGYCFQKEKLTPRDRTKAKDSR